MKSNFEFVPTEFNIADILTKPIFPSQFKPKSVSWLKGPVWILKDRKDWPKGNPGCLPEFRNCNEVPSVVCPVLDHDSLIPIQNYSSYNKLLNITISIMKAIANFCKTSADPVVQKRQAFQYLISQLQQKYYPEEYAFLKATPMSYSNVPSLVKELNMFLDKDGLIRSRGRHSKCLSMDYDAINPVLVSKHNHLTSLIVLDCHCRSKHLDVESTLNLLRQSGFWLPYARTFIKKTLKSCKVCARYNTRSFPLPNTPDLPATRVNFKYPFQHTAIDYTGYFYVDQIIIKIKTYISIFTCMNTRYVHLEVVNSLTIEEFILAFVRFYN